ncbi:UNKNOWN [Stylonychia lemnae]|uniref:Transmembrane protein n=1 Tax=Stylonychia lemnae TaxID=5949 RepID=A0A078ALE6_STYLE|nr:UNKNOWN [Stylonychia lemnae]|eukprot:CDW83039.1 UNKNOWN [Stylonychia lemnae]
MNDEIYDDNIIKDEENIISFKFKSNSMLETIVECPVTEENADVTQKTKSYDDISASKDFAYPMIDKSRPVIEQSKKEQLPQYRIQNSTTGSFDSGAQKNMTLRTAKKSVTYQDYSLSQQYGSSSNLGKIEEYQRTITLERNTDLGFTLSFYLQTYLLVGIQVHQFSVLDAITLRLSKASQGFFLLYQKLFEVDYFNQVAYVTLAAVIFIFALLLQLKINFNIFIKISIISLIAFMIFLILFIIQTVIRVVNGSFTNNEPLSTIEQRFDYKDQVLIIIKQFLQGLLLLHIALEQLFILVDEIHRESLTKHVNRMNKGKSASIQAQYDTFFNREYQDASSSFNPTKVEDFFKEKLYSLDSPLKAKYWMAYMEMEKKHRILLAILLMIIDLMFIIFQKLKLSTRLIAFYEMKSRVNRSGQMAYMFVIFGVILMFINCVCVLYNMTFAVNYESD